MDDPFMRNPNSGVQARAKAQNRANVMFLKQMGQSHPTGLTAPLLKLFEPRPPLEYKPPLEKRKCPPYSGMAQFVEKFAVPGDDEYAPPIPEVETSVERRARIHQKRLEEGAQRVAEEFEKYDPNSDPNISGDPYKTLFVARLNYETTESRIKREFEAYGPIKRVGIVEHPKMGLRLCDLVDNTTNKPRGYAFIEYMHSRDMKAAYKQADGKKLDNRRVLVDVERGRTVKNWRPRRLGGGLGTTRVGGEELNQRTSGREQPQAGVISRSEEPRIREDRDREKSRDRGRESEREREKSRERSHDKPRDRDQRDDRRHRDRDRTRDKDTERSRDRDHERTRDRGRDRGRDHDRERDRDRGHDRHREREKDRDRDYDHGDADYDRGRSRDREREYDRVEPKHDKDRKVEKERNYGLGEPDDEHERYGQPEHEQVENDNGRYGYYGHKEDGEYENSEVISDRYKDADRDHDRYDQMDEDSYKYDKAASRSQEREHDHHRTDRAHSREYDY